MINWIFYISRMPTLQATYNKNFKDGQIAVVMHAERGGSSVRGDLASRPRMDQVQSVDW